MAAKKKRSAKQKAATKKLVALMKKRRNSRKSSNSKRKTTRKTTNKSRKSSTLKRTTRKKSMPKRKTSRRSSAKKSLGNIFNRGTVGAAVSGIGAAALIGSIMDRFVPNSPITQVARPIAAYTAGGATGAIASIILSGGLNQIGSFFGMGGTTQGSQGLSV